MSKPATDFNDPINLQVMWNRLIFIADQADNVLGKTAFSPIVRENHDYVTVLLDSKGRALAQCTWSIPVFITSLPAAAQKYFLPKFPVEMLEEGDVLATNDPEIGTGHLPDVTMITPIFKNGKVVAYAGSIAHLPDIGGAPLHSEASDELVKFLDEYGLDDVDGLADAIHTRSEAQTRKAIREWPNGTYSAEVLLDGYDVDVKLKASVIVRDDSIHVDYTGTSDQVLHSINCRTNYRYAHSVYALKCLLDAETPNNEGCIVPITDEAPLGCILNPQEWTAGNSRNLIGHVIPSLIFKALEGIVPEKVLGDSGGAPIWAANCVGQRNDGTQYGSVQNFHGGQGARAEFDGLDTLSFPSNCKVTAIEMFEVAVPVLTERKELIADSGGAGKHRGGLGQRVVLRNLGKNPMNIYLASERVRHPCFGVVEGQSGSAGKVMKQGKSHFPKGKVVLQTGERLEVQTPGGGGWGRASERSSALIKQDISEGLVSAKAAKEIFGYSGAIAAAAE